MVTPLLRSLRRSFPQAYIGAVTSSGAADILRFNPHVDEVLPLKNRHLPYLLSREKRRLAAHFRSLKLNWALSLESNSDFTDLARRLGAEGLVTYDPKADHGNAQHIAPGDNEHSSSVHLRAGAAIGARPDGVETELYYPPEAERSVYAKLLALAVDTSKRIIGMHAGWGGRRQDPDDTRLRSWPADRFAELARHVNAAQDAQLILTGTDLDRPLNDEIAQRAGVAIVNAAGRFSLLESAALIGRMAAYVSIDSGPAHIAAAVGTPLITIWGPGILSATGPITGRGPVRTLYSPPPCAPCYGTQHMKTCTTNVCMRNISVDAVVSALDELLSGGGPRSQ